MPSTTISGAGAHASAAATDRVPASKAGVKGYLTNEQIKDYILGLANTWTEPQVFSPSTDITHFRRSTNAQEVHFYRTFTDAANYERITVFHNLAGAGLPAVVLQAAGTGVSGNSMFIGNNSTGSLTFRANNFSTWSIETSGSLFCQQDGNFDIGASGANRPRSIYVGTMVRTPKIETPMTGELTIAAGVITVTGSKHRVDTEADGATDDLDTINGGTDGMLLTLRAENDARTVVVKDGTGNIQIAGDMTLDNTQDTITLMYDGTLTAWLEIGRAASGA